MMLTRFFALQDLQSQIDSRSEEIAALAGTCEQLCDVSGDPVLKADMLAKVNSVRQSLEELQIRLGRFSLRDSDHRIHARDSKKFGTLWAKTLGGGHTFSWEASLLGEFLWTISKGGRLERTWLCYRDNRLFNLISCA